MKRPNWKYLFFLAVNMLSAFFLTKLIDDVTLVTNMQRIFVFLYFMTGSGAVSWIWMKKWKRVLWKQLIFSVVIAACFMIAAVPRLFYKNAKIQISPAESSNNNSLGSEIWLKEIRVDGNVHAVSQYENRKGWYIEDSSGSLVSYGEDFTQPVNMEVRYQDQVQLLFIAHKWSGKVKVETRNDSFVYDLYSKQGTDVIRIFTFADTLQRMGVFLSVDLYAMLHGMGLRYGNMGCLCIGDLWIMDQWLMQHWDFSCHGCLRDSFT